MIRTPMLAAMLAFAFAALADEPAAPPAAAASASPAQPPAAAASASPAPDQPAATAGAAHCLRSTGSRIQHKDGRCLPSPGRSIDREELERTGEIDNARALQHLDPNISIGR